MKKISNKDYQIKSKGKFDINQTPTLVDLQADKKEIEDELRKVGLKIAALQNKIYAAGTPAIYIGIQGMDTAGKDSLIREVFKDINPSGIEVYDFKKPTPLEHAHDFFWRHYLTLPERGKFGIHNRTHYEDVLIARIHPQLVLNQKIYGIDTLEDVDAKFWKKRFRQIRDFEKTQVENGMKMFKIFLHLSKDEQKNRFLRRINRDDKKWKFNAADLKERAYWEEYQVAYEDAINETATSHAPWYIVPADDKPTARLIVARILLDELRKLKISFPKMSVVEQEKFKDYKKALDNE
ncbi:MAG TPA: polyphosphate kinase 2 family protein [Lutibacter sp.]|nr:polyphosphate kinase 2 family protein [Lutibacter sp.]